MVGDTNIHRCFSNFVSRILKPPLFVPSVGLAAGICYGREFAAAFHFIWIGLALSALGFFAARKRPSVKCFILLFCFFLGFLFEVRSRLLTPDHMAFVQEGKGVMDGRVVSLPETAYKGKRAMTSFVLEAGSWWSGRKLHPIRGKVQVFLFYAPEGIEYGETLRIRGILSVPKRAANPGELDYGEFLRGQGIYRVLQGFGSKCAWKRAQADDSLQTKVERIRRKIQTRIESLYPFPDRELIKAIWLGLRRNLSRELFDLYVRTGTVHLLSISGLHVSLVGGFFYFLFRWMGFGRKWNALASMTVIFLYALIAGGNPPVLRSALMAAFIFGGILLERDHEIWNVLVIAFFLILISSPNHLFLLSFQLSFMSVGVLVLFGSRNLPEQGNQHESSGTVSLWLGKLTGWLIDTMRTSFSITIVLLPVLAAHFHLAALSSVLANIVAIPVFFLILIVSLFSYGMSFVWPFLAGMMIRSVIFVHSWLLWFLSGLESIPWFTWHLPSPHWLALVIYFSALGLFYWHPMFKKWRPVGLMASPLIFLFLMLQSIRPSVTFLDAGFADLVFVQPPRHLPVLIRSGRRLGESRFHWTVQPFLMSRGVREFQFLTSQRGGRSFEMELRKLSESFRARKFEETDFRHAQLFWSNEGVLEATLLEVCGKRLLLIFNLHEDLARRLERAELGSADILFIAHQERERAVLLNQLLEQFLPRFVVINQRRNLSEWLRNFKNQAGSTLHFTAQDSALTLRLEPGRIQAEPFQPV